MNVSIFKTPIMYASWGLRNGGEFGNSAAALRDHCIAHGFKSVAVEWGTMVDFHGDTVDITTRDDVKVLQDAGLEVIGWNVADENVMQYITGLGVNAVQIQIEGPGQYDGALRAFEAMRAAGWAGKKSIVTTYWGLLNNDSLTSVQDRYAKLVALGCSEAWVECYAGDMSNAANLDGMLQHGVAIGMPAEDLFPLCGTYRGELPATYTGLTSRAPHFGCYIAEPMSEAQWIAWGGVKPNVSQVYYWQIVAKPTGTVLHEERAVTLPDGDGLTKTLNWLEANKPTIRVTNDIEVKRVLKTV